MANSKKIDSAGNTHEPQTQARHEYRENADKTKAALRFIHEMKKGMQAGKENGWLTSGQIRDHLRKRCQEG